MIRVFFYLLIIYCVNAEVVKLKEGSLEHQTLGKDGFILFYKTKPDIWDEMIAVSEKLVNVTFFEMDCEKYECSENELVNGYPSIVYSVDNQFWEPFDLSENTYDFIFNTFVKDCTINRDKCKPHELSTLLEFEDETSDNIINAKNDLQNRVAQLESSFEEYYKNLEKEYHKKRAEIRDDLEKVEDMIHILNKLIIKL